MAWIAQQSAAVDIPRRDEPYLTQRLKDALTKETLPRYETLQGALLPTLHAVQEAVGWLPGQALEEVAEFLKLEPSLVLDTVTFYEEFRLSPRGRHTIAVCRSIACEVCNHSELTDLCRRRLGVEIGETTEDGAFTLIELECIGACDGAPAILIDETLHESVTTRRLEELLDEADGA